LSLFDIFMASPAWAAAEAEHHALSISDLWFPLANFLIFAYIIVRYAVPPVRGFLQSRHAEVLAAVNQAATKKQQAEAVVQDYQARLARLEQEVRTIHATFNEEGEREKSRLVKDAEALAAKIQQDALLLADQEVKVARQKLREEMANEAAAEARALIARNLSAADQGRLVEDFIRGVGQAR